jgi:DHA2 family multidrug resistance protein
MFGLIGFTIFFFSLWFSHIIEMLVFFRIGQGLWRSTYTLSQTLLMRIFPSEKHAQAMGLGQDHRHWTYSWTNFGWFNQ